MATYIQQLVVALTFFCSLDEVCELLHHRHELSVEPRVQLYVAGGGSHAADTAALTPGRVNSPVYLLLRSLLLKQLLCWWCAAAPGLFARCC